MLMTVAFIQGELSLKSNVVWENDRAVGGGLAAQTLSQHTCSSRSWLLLLGTSSGLWALVSVREHRVSLPETAQGTPALPTASHHIPISLLFPASPYDSNLSFHRILHGFESAAKQ